MRRCGETGVSPSAASALSDDEAVPGHGEIVKHFAGVGVVDDGPDRRGYVDRFAVASSFVAAFAVASALGFVFGIKTEMKESVVMLAGDQGYVAAASAVAPAWTAARDVFFAAKREAAVAPVAGFDVNPNFVDEHLRGRWSAASGRL